MVVILSFATDVSVTGTIVGDGLEVLCGNMADGGDKAVDAGEVEDGGAVDIGRATVGGGVVGSDIVTVGEEAGVGAGAQAAIKTTAGVSMMIW